jgi:hypothetical protein
MRRVPKPRKRIFDLYWCFAAKCRVLGTAAPATRLASAQDALW